MALYQLGDIAPTIHSDAYVAAEATIIGNVTLKARASAWPGVVIRGDNVTAGYESNPKANAENFTHGWFRTGDQGMMDSEGHVTITGRIKEIIVTSTGEKVPPGDLQLALTSDPLFAQAFVVGELRPFIAAVVVLNPSEWRRLASRPGAARRARLSTNRRSAARGRAPTSPAADRGRSPACRRHDRWR